MNWRKASYSTGGANNCVEVANAPGTGLPGTVGVRDTKQAHLSDDARTVLHFTARAWRGFTASLR